MRCTLFTFFLPNLWSSITTNLAIALRLCVSSRIISLLFESCNSFIMINSSQNSASFMLTDYGASNMLFSRLCLVVDTNKRTGSVTVLTIAPTATGGFFFGGDIGKWE